MKRLLRHIALVLALTASSAAVLHTVHLDDEHLTGDSHCAVCHTITASTGVMPALDTTPTLIAFDLLLPSKNAHFSNILSFLKDNRGPPLA